jgi:hypothetical protein
MTLEGIFFTLSMGASSTDAKQARATSKLINYNFGDIIDVNGFPYYKIEKEGKLTVYYTERNGGN